MDECVIFNVRIWKHTEFNSVFRNNEGMSITLIKFYVVSFKAVFQTLSRITHSAAVHNAFLPRATERQSFRVAWLIRHCVMQTYMEMNI
jgi:hypothetical protein